jgi:hypothetical protein
MNTTMVSGTALLAMLAVDAVGEVIEYERDAHGWLAASPREVKYCFEQDYPDTGGCLLPDDDLIAVIPRAVTITITALTKSGAERCAVEHVGCDTYQADAILEWLTVIDFDPPVHAFYTYYASMIPGDVVVMTLYAGAETVATLVGPPGQEDQSAVGHGFTSTTPIDRVELRADPPGDLVVIGAYCGLQPGEPSLDRWGETETARVRDLGYSFDPCGLATCFHTDIDRDGSVDFSDFQILVSQWGPDPALSAADIDGDGIVGVWDFLMLLRHWGPCPTEMQSLLQDIRRAIALYNEQNYTDPYNVLVHAPGDASFWDPLIEGGYLPSAPINPLTPNPDINDPSAVVAAPKPGAAWVWLRASPGDPWTFDLYAVDENGDIYDGNGDGYPD